MGKYQVGMTIEVEVCGIEDYGIFIKTIDGYTGLIHISEISNNFVSNVSEYVDLEEKINAKIIDLDEETKRLKLSIKDINYLKSEENNNIKETGEGFDALRKNLDMWINAKKEEIREEETKKN